MALVTEHKGRRVLVAGWFSYPERWATAGDLMAKDVVCDWLDGTGIEHDVALAPVFEGGVDLVDVIPEKYTDVFFVCGPMADSDIVEDFLQRFSGSSIWGINLSMLKPLENFNPFDVLLERDSSRTARPELAMLCKRPLVPLTGVVLVHPQKEYGKRARHAEADAAIGRLIDSQSTAAIPIDTCLDPNATGLRTAAEVESLIARMDVVMTTRLHGLILSIKNGVPAIAIDAISKGAKVSRQAKTIGWPLVFQVDDLRDDELIKAFEYCLTPEAHRTVLECRDRARAALDDVRKEFYENMKQG